MKLDEAKTNEKGKIRVKKRETRRKRMRKDK